MSDIAFHSLRRFSFVVYCLCFAFSLSRAYNLAHLFYIDFFWGWRVVCSLSINARNEQHNLWQYAMSFEVGDSYLFIFAARSRVLELWAASSHCRVDTLLAEK